MMRVFFNVTFYSVAFVFFITLAAMNGWLPDNPYSRMVEEIQLEKSIGVELPKNQLKT
jgi:hypothetical protein